MAWTTAMSNLGRVRAWQGSGRTRYGRDERGVASIEMALIFPVMLILFIGLVDVSNLMTANRRVTQTAGTLGDLVTQAPGSVTPAQLDGFINAASSVMNPFPADAIGLEFYTFTNTSGGGHELNWQYKSAGGVACGDPPEIDEEMEELMGESNDVVVSRTCYEWDPVLGIILGFSTSIIQDEITMRPRQTARITCDTCPK